MKRAFSGYISKIYKDYLDLHIVDRGAI